MFALEDDTTSFILDDYFVSWDSGLPKGNYKLNDIIGDGALISGSNALDGRVIKMTRIFTKDHESEREDFFKWFTLPPYKETYLRKTTTDYTARQRVYPKLSGGEVYGIRDFNVSKEISFEMLMEIPFFESTSLTTSTNTITSTAQETVIITLAGLKNYPIYEFYSTIAITDFAVKTYEGYGFKVTHNISAESTIAVYTTESYLICKINDVRVENAFSAESTPFELLNGSNTLYVTASSGLFRVKYYKRYL